MLGLRHQLAVHSPLPLAALLSAARSRPLDGVAAASELKRQLAAEYEAETVVLCGSGTQALQLAIEHATARLGGRAPVALPAFCCYDVASAAVGAGVSIGLYDLDPETLSPDLVSLERLLKHGVRVVVVAHLYGIPVHWRAVAELAAAYDAVLIEDAAQGHGARWRGRLLGSLGNFGVLSFGRGKGWTGGRGGALLLRGGGAEEGALCDAHAAEPGEVGILISALAQWALGRPALYGLPMAVPGLALGETVYHPPTPPHSMPSRGAQLLLRTREAAQSEALSRKRIAAELLGAIASAPAARAIQVVPGAEPGYLRLPVRLPRGLGSLVDLSRARRLGIAPSYPTTLAKLPVVRERLLAEFATPGATTLARELLTIPVHSLLSPQDVRRLCVILAGSTAAR